MDCIEVGNGPPVALIHGVGLRADAWGAQIEALAAHYHVRAYDTPGRGGSTPVGERRSLADYTDRFAEAIAAFGEPTLVAGHSMGALIVLDLGIRYPDLVRGVAALNGVFRRSDETKQAVQARAASLVASNQADLSATLPRWFGDIRRMICWRPKKPAAGGCLGQSMRVTPRPIRCSHMPMARPRTTSPQCFVRPSS